MCVAACLRLLTNLFVIQAGPAVGMKLTKRNPVKLFKQDYMKQLKKEMEERRRVITKSEFKRAHEYVASKLKGVETLQSQIKIHQFNNTTA